MAPRGTTTATILFTDVVGSTALRARIGENAADQLFVDHHRQLGHIVSRHGGRVLKSGGDGVMASFTSASEAVNAAVALQEHVHANTPQLSVRVGVAAGDVAWDDDDCFGLPVVTAARLQSTAEGGEILVSYIVRQLAGDRAGDRYEHIGAFELKGLPEPVDAFTVGWNRPRALDEAIAEPGGQPPLPLALNAATRHPLVGRDADIAMLRDAWADAASGPGRIVLVGGEAGAGKTRLASELAAELHDAGACVLYGGCDSDLALPYQPWVHAVDQLLTALPQSLRSVDMTTSMAPLASLLSHAEWLTAPSRRASLDPGAERYRTYTAFAAALGESCNRWPTLVVLDDLHWAGTQTLALLRHLARAGLPPHVLVVGAFRDTGDELSDPLASCLADLRRVAVVSRLRLGALDSSAVERFVADAVGHPLDNDLHRLAGELSERSGGNAFYLGELWRQLLDSGVVGDDGGKWVVHGTAAGALPEGVREVVIERLAHLTPAARRVVDLAALSAHRVDLQVLEAAGRLSPEELDSAVDELVAAGLLVEVEGRALVYRFAHALVRDTVEAGVSPHARARLHRALAEAIEIAHGADRRPVLAELAGHYAAATGPIDKIVYYGRRAAGQALRAAAYEEAVSHLSTVLEHTPTSIDRAAVLVELGRVQLFRGAFEDSRRACLDAFQIGTTLADAAITADAAVGFEMGMHFPGLPGGPTVDMLRSALDLVGDEPSPARARVMASLGRALVFRGQSVEGMAIAEAAVALARVLGDDEILSIALQSIVTASTDSATLLATATELAELAERIDDPWSTGYANANVIRIHFVNGQVEEAARVLERHRITSEAGHFATFQFMAHAYETVFALAAGDLPGAEAAAERARAKGAADDAPFDEGVYGLQMYAIRRAQGRLAEVEPVMRVLAATADPPPTWRPGLASIYAELGMFEDARQVFESLAPDGFASVPRDAVWPVSVTFLAETCIALGDRRRAAMLYDELGVFSGRNLMGGMTICFGPADRLLGGLAMLLGRADAADEYFQAALDLARRSQSPLWTAEVQADWANALDGRDPERAAALAAEALTTARLLGIGRLIDRPRPAVVVGIGASERPSPGAHDVPPLPDGLSSREVEVLRLMATGLSNRDIGERLFISQNTVANHVRAVLRKTTSANRTEASLYAVRRGLVE